MSAPVSASAYMQGTAPCASFGAAPSADSSAALSATNCQRPGGLKLTRRGLSHTGLTPGSVWADMGCGTGESVRFLRAAGHAAFGLDVTRPPSGVPSFPLILGRAEAPPLAHAIVDGLLCECVLCLLPEPERVLKRFADITRPGGQLVLTDLYAKPSSHHRDTPQTFLSRPELEAALHRAGWRVTLFEDHSPALKAYAAQLVWQSEQTVEDCRLLNAARGCGYGLWTAHKES